MAPDTAAEARHARAENVERIFHRELFDAAPRDVRDAIGWACHEVEGALVSVAAHAPSILLNRTIGLGVDAAATEHQIDRLCALYADAGVGRYFVHVGPSARPHELDGWLRARGLAPQRSWVKFERPPQEATAARSDLRVAPVTTEEDAAALGAIVAQGFDLGDAAAGIFPALVGRPGWHLFGARDGDDLVAGGAMFLRDGCAYLDFAATAQTHRSRGAQSALLAARIEAARAQGAEFLWTETGEAVPGDPQHSYHNIERAGFTPAFHSRNFAPPR